MAFSVGDVVKVGLASWWSGQLGLNIRFYRVTAVTGADVTSQIVADDMEAIFRPLYAALMHNQAEWLGIAVRNISPNPLEAAAVSSALPEGGTAGADPLPSQTCGLIKLTTALAGRAKRGRAYAPFPATADSDADNSPLAGYLVKLQNLADALIATQAFAAGADAMTMKPLIFSIPNALQQQLVTGAVIRDAWATQRRRGGLGQSNPKQIPLV